MTVCRNAIIAVAVYVTVGLPLCLLVVTGVEYGHALKLRSEIQAAADAATVVAAKAAPRGPGAMRVAVARALAELKRPGAPHLAAVIEMRTVPAPTAPGTTASATAAHRAMSHGAMARAAVALRIPLTVLTRVSSLYGNTAFHFTVDSFAATTPLFGQGMIGVAR